MQKKKTSFLTFFYKKKKISKGVEQPVLVALMAGDAAHFSESINETEIVQRVMEVLRRRFPNAPDPIKHVITRWKADKFSRGTYSYYSVNSGLEDYDVLGRTCFFLSVSEMSNP